MNIITHNHPHFTRLVSFIFLAASLSINAIERKRVFLQTCRLSNLSVYLSVGRFVGPVGELWKNGWLDLDAVWGGEWGRSRDGCIRWGGNRRRRDSFVGKYGASHCNQWDFV